MDDFDKIAKFYDSFFIQFYYYWVHKTSFRFLKNYLQDYSVLLDIACGSGNFLKKYRRQYSHSNTFGIDKNAEMITLARRKNVGEFTVENAENLPFKNNQFDVITILDAFYYFQSKEHVLRGCSRTLKPKGYLFLCYPAFDIFPKFFPKILKISSRLFFYNLENHSAFDSVKELTRMANATGFSLVSAKTKMLHRFILFQKT